MNFTVFAEAVFRVTGRVLFGLRYHHLRRCASEAVLLSQRTVGVEGAATYATRRYQSSSHSCQNGSDQVIDVDVVEVEVLNTDTPHVRNGRTRGVDDPASITTIAAETVSALDPFAKAKVINFLARMFPSAVGVSSPAGSAEVRKIQGGDTNGDHTFHARLCLPLPPEMGGERHAEGYAANAKDAEILASMHAERILDALGLPLFQVPSRQRRHAEAARAAGRHAPLPGDPPQDPSVPTPPPLLYVPPGAVAQMERKLHLDAVVFQPVTSGVFTPLQHTLASPYFLDSGSPRRIRNFFAAYNVNFERHVDVVALHKQKPDRSQQSKGRRSDVASEPPLFLARLQLPIAARFGSRICMGKAPTRKDAITLASMHAELTVDALGLALYPNDRDRQAAHATECRQVNRWCAEPGDCEYRYSIPSPEPLQLVDGNGTGSTVGRSGPPPALCSSCNASEAATGARWVGIDHAEVQGGTPHSVESVLMQHNRAVLDMGQVVDLPHLDPAAMPLFKQYLAHCGGGTAAPVSPFFVEALGPRGSETYRATASVPLLNAAGETTTRKPFVAIGVSSSGGEGAELAAATHALRVLTVLNYRVATVPAFVSAMSAFCRANGHPLYDPTKPAQPISSLPADHAWLAPVRCVGEDHLGRIKAPQLAAARRREDRRVSQQVHTEPTATPSSYLNAVEGIIANIRRNRAGLPVQHYSLEEDAAGRIIVSPHASTKDGQSYVHTLAAVRTPDVHAINRLSDYLERHGKKLEMVVRRSQQTVADGATSLKLFAAKVTLPVPVRHTAALTLETDGVAAAAAPRLVAHGEAYAEGDALVMCAMHAELLLDTVGVPFYDHVLLQRRHADTARMLGRWAPLHGSGAVTPTPFSTLPPPIRKEDAQSCTWARLQKSTGLAEASVREGNEVVTTSSGEAPRADPKDGRPAEAAAPTDEPLCDLAALQVLHSREIPRQAVKHAQLFYEQRGEDFFRSVRQYAVSTQRHGIVHRCLSSIPLPAVYGRRWAVGCANNKRQAFQLCAAHAAYVLDALNISVHRGKQQTEYAKLAALRGRQVPRPGDPLRPPSTPSPPGLCCLTGVVGDRPDAPELPSTADMERDGRVWTQYVHSARTHIEKVKELELHEALFELKQAPRGGIPVEDEALQHVESMPLDPTSRSSLAAVCAKAGLSPPPSHLRYEVYGRGPQKVYYTCAAVEGTPYTARGVGDSGSTSVKRAAMHYAYLVTHTVAQNQSPGNMPKSGAACTLPSPLHTALDGGYPRYNASTVLCDRDHYTLCGIEAALSLFAATHPPFKPVRVTLKHRAATTAIGPQHTTTVVALAEFEDETGLRVAGKGGHPSEPSRAAEHAVSDLFSLMERRPVFRSVTAVVRQYPQLQCGALTGGPANEDVMTRLQAELAAAAPRVTTTASATAVIDAMRAVPLRGNYSFFNSQKGSALLELTERRLDPSSLPASLAAPSAVRASFPAQGLVWQPTAAGGSEREVTPVGMAVAYLMQCFPAQLRPNGTYRHPPNVPELPLQLGRLLLAGLLWQCVPQVVRMAASLMQVAGVNSSPSAAVDSVDLVWEAMSQEPAEEVKAYEAEVLSRLDALNSSVQQYGTVPGALARLLAGPTERSTPPQPEVLALCVVFATYPSVWTALMPAAAPSVGMDVGASEESSGLWVESFERQQRANIPSCSIREGTNGAHCFAAFDYVAETAMKHDGKTVVRLYGCSIPSPVASLVASVVGANDGGVLHPCAEVPCLTLLYNRLVPLAVQQPSFIRCLEDLQRCVHDSINLLRPLPQEVAECLVALLKAEWRGFSTDYAPQGVETPTRS